MTALMSYSEYKEIKGELKNIEIAFDMGQKVAFAYMADCLGASLTYGGLERVIKKVESVKDACKKYNLHHSNIVACCNRRRKTVRGYKWEYVK